MIDPLVGRHLVDRHRDVAVVVGISPKQQIGERIAQIIEQQLPIKPRRAPRPRADLAPAKAELATVQGSAAAGAEKRQFNEIEPGDHRQVNRVPKAGIALDDVTEAISICQHGVEIGRPTIAREGGQAGNVGEQIRVGEELKSRCVAALGGVRDDPPVVAQYGDADRLANDMALDENRTIIDSVDQPDVSGVAQMQHAQPARTIGRLEGERQRDCIAPECPTQIGGTVEKPALRRADGVTPAELGEIPFVVEQIEGGEIRQLRAAHRQAINQRGEQPSRHVVGRENDFDRMAADQLADFR
jgi:hypothetical protein